MVIKVNSSQYRSVNIDIAGEHPRIDWALPEWTMVRTMMLDMGRTALFKDIDFI
jgi:hypothetical protein